MLAALVSTPEPPPPGQPPQASVEQLLQAIAQLHSLRQHDAQRLELLQTDNALLRLQIEQLKLQLLALRRRHFGASSERVIPQAQLFPQSVQLALPAEQTEQISYRRRRRSGRPGLPKGLPREIIDYPLSEQQLAGCTEVERIGSQTSEQLDYTPAQFRVLVHVRGVYRALKDGERTILTAQMPEQPLPKSNASASLLAAVLTGKFEDHLPLARLQNKVFKRSGLAIARSTLDGWVLGSAELLLILYELLVRHVLCAPRLHVDDTVLRRLVKDLGHAKQAYMWAYLGAGARQLADGSWQEHPAAVVFEFTASRAGEHPQRFLRDYRGYLQADAFAGYEPLYRDGKIQEVGCWAHCRRHLHELTLGQSSPGLAHQGLAWIKQLYAIEAAIQDKRPDEKRALRQAQAVPLLEQFGRWLQGHAAQVLPKSPLGKAIHYALSNWPALVRYTEDGILEIDNNRIERAVRPIAQGRKAYLFVGSERGGKAAAVIYSIIETCRLHQLDAYAYLADVLRRLPGHPVNRLHELLPFNWQAAP